MEPDRQQIHTFIHGIFRYASSNTFYSTRAFYEETQKTFGCFGVQLSGGLDFIVKTAFEHALRAANNPKPIVCCTPIATFSSKNKADEEHLAEGLALSVECDRNPVEAGSKLIAVLGDPTFAILSGGEWIDPETGEIQPRRHFYWRLTKASKADKPESQAKLKRVRALATCFVGGDISGVTIVHPMRVPGSWHRKGEPIMCEIEFEDLDREIDLDEALKALEAVCPELPAKPNGASYGGNGADWDTKIHGIISGENYHASIRDLTAALLAAGMHPGAAVNLTRALMDSSQGARDARWRERYDDIPRAVSTAQDKFNAATGPVIEVDYVAISGMIEPPKEPEKVEEPVEEPKVAAEPKPAPARAEDQLEQYTYVPGLLGEVTDWIEATAIRPNRIIALGAAVTVVGTLIGRRIATPTRSGTHLYIAVIADSGAGKQHPMNCIRRLMRAAMAESHVKGPSRLYSLPAVEDLIIANPLCLFMIDELGAFLQSVTSAKAISNVSGISEILRTLWNTSFESIETGFRKGQPGQIVRCPALSTYGLTTEAEFLTALQGASINNGFLNRHTILKADLPLVLGKPTSDLTAIPANLAGKLGHLYRWENSLMSIGNPNTEFDPIVLPFGPAAAKLWEEIDNSVIAHRNNNPGESTFFTRTAEMGLRLATIRAVGRELQEASVEVPDLEWGAAIAEGACQYMANAMQDHIPQTQRGEMAEKILGYIRRHGPVTVRRIQQQMRGKIRSQEIRDMLTQFSEGGLIETTPNGYKSV